MRLWRYGDPLKTLRRWTAAVCKECGKAQAFARDLCERCYNREYYHRKKATERVRKNARRAYLKCITPPWADREAIRQIYKDCPEGHEVDHVIPIRGRMVSGLHVEANLQYLRAKANKQKFNKHSDVEHGLALVP